MESLEKKLKATLTEGKLVSNGMEPLAKRILETIQSPTNHQVPRKVVPLPES